MEKLSRKSSTQGRAQRAVESFGTASAAIGECHAGMRLFCVTRGQWSMLDAIWAVLDQVGASKVSLWTWTVAEYEVQVLSKMRQDSRITGGRLIIDAGAHQEAQANIAEHGALVFHPRTGVPIDNPYLKIKAQAMNQLLKIKIRNVSKLWE